MDVDTQVLATPTGRSAASVQRTGPTPAPRAAVATAPVTAPATTPATAPATGNRSSRVPDGHRIRCPLCRRPHRLHHCGIFRGMRPLQRQQVAQAHGHCVNCLSQTHRLQECESRGLCQICNRPHHTLLHRTAMRDDHRPAIPRSHATRHQSVTRVHQRAGMAIRRRQPRPQPRRSTGLSSVVATLQQLQRLLG
uniref:Uncharacterized protein n=1 Tax=Bactrocera latifrons TaxID=174628 RepID=A0A0K8WMA0_BACLA